MMLEQAINSSNNLYIINEPSHFVKETHNLQMCVLSMFYKLESVLPILRWIRLVLFIFSLHQHTETCTRYSMLKEFIFVKIAHRVSLLARASFFILFHHKNMVTPLALVWMWSVIYNESIIHMQVAQWNEKKEGILNGNMNDDMNIFDVG